MSPKNSLPSKKASWIEINSAHLLNNIQVYRDKIESNTSFGAVVKGNAYGHGLLQVASAIHDAVDLLMVVDAEDAFALRNFEKKKALLEKRILVLGVVTVHEAAECARKNIEVAVTNDDWLCTDFMQTLQKEHKRDFFPPLKLHVHVETGLSREGWLAENVQKNIKKLCQHLDLFQVKGVMSHFANVEDVTEQDYSYFQMENLDKIYKNIVSIIGKKDQKIEKHIAQSAAPFVLKGANADMVRVGISLYGYWPSQETKISARAVSEKLPTLKPVLTWKCHSQIIKKISADTCVGYGCTFKSTHDMTIAVFPVGYFDGYPRLVSGKAHVLVNGKRCPVIGRVMMNHIVVDVTHVYEVQTHVVATLIGQDGNEQVTAEMLAVWAETISYEILARLGGHLKRVVI